MVLQYLVLHRDRPVAREVLMEVGWPEASAEAAGNNLNTTISILRRTLKQALGHPPRGLTILFEDGCYHLNPDLNLRIDVVEFDTCYKRGLSCERNGQIAEAVAAYRAAIAFYQGDLLMGNVDDTSMIIERERLTSTFLMLLSKLGQHCLAKGDYEEAIEYAHRLLEQDPCDEDAHRLVIRCFARLGKRAQALRQYDLCRSLLQSELGIEPALETAALRQRVACGEAGI